VIRIFLVVMFLPLFMKFYAGADLSASALRTASITDLTVQNVIVLAAIAAVGYYFGKLVKLPAPVLTGPMIVSAIIHITGLHTSVQPWEPIAIAQWILGSIVGCRFADVDRAFLKSGMIDGFVSVVIMMLISFAFAGALHMFAGLNLMGTLLAYAPGGFVEMALVALATGMDVAVVSVHHLSRILWITIPGPILFRYFREKQKS
ncbi:MAG: AbrB family transcriptional regulator, partial [Alphaproteobacteria bacterium]